MKQQVKITIEPIYKEDQEKRTVIVNVEHNKEEQFIMIKFLNELQDYVKYAQNIVVLGDKLDKLVINYDQKLPD